MMENRSVLNEFKISDILFFLLCVSVYIFNFNTNKIFSLSGNTWTNIFILLFIVSQGCLMLVSKKILWNNVFTFELLFLIFCFTSSLYSLNSSDSLSKTITIALVFIMAICIYQYIVLNNCLLFALKTIVYSGTFASLYILIKSGFTFGSRMGDVIGDENLVGIAIAIAISIAIYLLINEKKKLYVLPIVIMIIVVLLTGSRAAAVLVFLSIFANVMLLAIINQCNVLKVIALFIMGIVLVSVLWYAIMNVPALYDSLGIRFVSFLQIRSGQHSITNERSTMIRAIFGRRAFEMFCQNPIFGKGINSFSSYNVLFSDGWYCFCHCGFLEILSGVGLLGFLLFYGPFIRALYCSIKIKNPDTKKYRILTIILVSEFLLSEVFLVTYYEKTTWILVAILAVLLGETEAIAVEDESWNYK